MYKITTHHSKAVVPKLVRAVPQIKVSNNYVLLPSIKIFCIPGRKLILQWSLITQNNNMVWVLRYRPKNRILPPVWEPLL